MEKEEKKETDIEQALRILRKFKDVDVLMAVHKSGIYERFTKSVPKPPGIEDIQKIPKISPESKKKWIEELKENRERRGEQVKSEKALEDTPVECVSKLFIGWNLISIPLDTGDSSVSDLIPSHLRSSLTPWYWFDCEKNTYVDVSDLPNNFSRSYWVPSYTKDIITLVLRGIPIRKWSTSVCAGWNMTGSVLCSPCSDCYRDMLEIFIPLIPPKGFKTSAGFIPPAYRYLPMTPSNDYFYVDSLSIYPFMGYWTNFKFSGTLTLDFCEIEACQYLIKEQCL